MDSEFSNQELFQIQTAYNRLKSNKYDSRKGWKRLNRRISGRRFFIRLGTVAAVLMLLATVGGLWFRYYLPADQGQVLPEGIIRLKGIPVLTLADGTSIPLTGQEKEPMHEANTRMLFCDTAACLQYVKDSTPAETGYETFNTLHIPKGAEYRLILSDGTRIWLNSETTLRYPVRFSGSRRQVELEGEAYFDVARDTVHPFIVKIQEGHVKVLGTSFNISNYRNEGKMNTTLVQGMVEISYRGKTHPLTPRHCFTADKTSGRTRIIEVDPSLYTSWKEGRVVFHNEPLEDIILRLSRWYDFEVFYVNPELKQLHFGGTINRYNPFSTVLRYLERTADIRFDIQGKTVVITKGSD